MKNLVEKIVVPDLNGTSEINVIEVLVASGDQVEREDSLITVEGDKAAMDIPSPLSGIIKDVKVKVGDIVKEGDEILTIEAQDEKEITETGKKTFKQKEKLIQRESESKFQVPVIPKDENFNTTVIHAGPGVRRMAWEFGVDLLKVKGAGQKGRILREDIQKYIRQQLQISKIKEEILSPISVAHNIDFSKFGPVEKETLSKTKKIAGTNLARNWATIPHVTQFWETDITELEIFREKQKIYAEKNKVRLTLLAFVIKAVVNALKYFPHFNASLDSAGETLILKKYFHIGIAVDTPTGLVVPVIRDADKKRLLELAKELEDLSKKARANRLSLHDMQGGCFSVSNLGGAGGTFFTPIINSPEVAILGIAKMEWKLSYSIKDNICKTRLILPLSLSYDHRVIDGVEGARFIAYLSERLSDIRTLLL
ncbi:2-oxo acid dehydrogenase subunit E2 [Coxiella-like endosymbiont of Amblyomma americanum]|uniref:2-oxo acid dehydrogenase subunit E2 n=1 Tax=Coxiella-like endosymbiont of Amblyomma americanum TaxID=1987500 RepID=UPI000F89DEC3|nr:2-oxo acid dehydrogenase subunit E2 [Coxiella-like endosymbiont of Amblyomma americanum]AUJ58836.1 branched-chain alpha-keto acid dehydrogenase subunit E2 [Coxiella-like endosymbiont of Amblyomma americanum]